MRLRLGILLLLTLGTAAVRAQPSVTLQFRQNEFYAGEAFELRVVVANFQQCQPPKLPALPDCQIRAAGTPSEMQSTRIINGHRTDSHTRTYSFEVVPGRIGSLEIPPVTVQVDGQVLKTQPRTIKVAPSNADELLRVTIVTPHQRVYVGQLVKLTMEVWVQPARYGSRRLSERDMLAQLQAIDFGPFPVRTSHVTRRQSKINGKDKLFYVYEFATDYIPEHPGALDLHDIRVGLAYPASDGYRHLRTSPESTAIEVLPVPQDHRPANFSGAVGLFDIEAHANPTEVRVGDPINLTIDIFGSGPLDTLPPPLLASDPALTRDFRVPTEPLAGETRSGTRHFEVVIRATNDRITEIPAIEYPYFDPDAERFVIARSDPITLEVEPAAELALPEPTQLTAPGIADGTELQKLDGLHDIVISPRLLLATRRPPTVATVLTLTLAPPVVVTAVWACVALVRVRRSNPARQRRQRAARTARVRLQQAAAGPPEERAAGVAAALAGYVADRLDLPVGRCTDTAGAERLREAGLSESAAADWERLLADCEEATFAGAAQPSNVDLCSAARNCIQTVERERLQ